MRWYHYRLYTGPTGVSDLAERLRVFAMPWQRVEFEGTQHVYINIAALYRYAADREVDQWLQRAGERPQTAYHQQIFRPLFLRATEQEA